jgi:probable rRNA maturation factor
MVRVHNGHPRLRLSRTAVAAVLHALDAAFPTDAARVSPGELSVAFLTDVALARLHETFLDDPSPTDVITFPGVPGLGQAGEICLSVDYALAFATGHGHDFSGELTLYLVHGWLHLAGYDDRKPVLKKRMRAAEARAMQVLAGAKKIPRFALAS